MTSGGKRPGAGRPPGSRDRKPRLKVLRSDIHQRIRLVLEQHPEWGPSEIGAAIGETRQAVWEAMKRAKAAR